MIFISESLLNGTKRCLLSSGLSKLFLVNCVNSKKTELYQNYSAFIVMKNIIDIDAVEFPCIMFYLSPRTFRILGIANNRNKKKVARGSSSRFYDYSFNCTLVKLLQQLLLLVLISTFSGKPQVFLTVYNISKKKQMLSQVTLYHPDHQSDKKKYFQQVCSGLQCPLKHLPSHYRYNDEGSEIFSLMNKLEVYYLFEAQNNILKVQGDNILAIFGPKFNLVQLGCGDGLKTKLLLQKALEKKVDFEYIGIDMSQGSNKVLCQTMASLPNLKMTVITALFEDGISWVEQNMRGKNVFFIVGSSLSNSTDSECIDFLKLTANKMKKGDLFSLTHDLMKDPQIIQKAYCTQLQHKFILNNIKRINQDLNGTFDLTKFYTVSDFDPFERAQIDYIISKEHQSVRIEDRLFSFKRGEAVKISISKKRYVEEIDEMFHQAGLKRIHFVTDSNNYLGNFVYVKE